MTAVLVLHNNSNMEATLMLGDTLNKHHLFFLHLLVYCCFCQIILLYCHVLYLVLGTGCELYVS